MVCVGVCLRVVGVGGNGGLEVTGGGRYCKKSWSWSRFTPLTLTISSRSLTFCLHTRWFVKQRGTVGAQAWRFVVLHAYIFEFIDISGLGCSIGKLTISQYDMQQIYQK